MEFAVSVMRPSYFGPWIATITSKVIDADRSSEQHYVVCYINIAVKE
jgi:hypothetical protein